LHEQEFCKSFLYLFVEISRNGTNDAADAVNADEQ
jgi:hypothetical protein